jgi:hypothetical protein
MHYGGREISTAENALLKSFAKRKKRQYRLALDRQLLSPPSKKSFE